MTTQPKEDAGTPQRPAVDGAAEPGGVRIVYTARVRRDQVRAAIAEAFDIIARETGTTALYED